MPRLLGAAKNVGCCGESWRASTSACSRPPAPTTRTRGPGVISLPGGRGGSRSLLQRLAKRVLDLLRMRAPAGGLHGLAHQERERLLLAGADLGRRPRVRAHHLPRQREEGGLVFDGQEPVLPDD